MITMLQHTHILFCIFKTAGIEKNFYKTWSNFWSNIRFSHKNLNNFASNCSFVFIVTLKTLKLTYKTVRI